MLSSDIFKSIEDRVREILEPLGFVLVELKVMRSADTMILRFLVDRKEGGITLGECAQLNNQIGQLFEEKNIISDKYTLEVSSPGLDRPLVASLDFKRALEKIIHIFLKEADGGKLESEGRLVRLNTDGIFIIDDADKEVFIPFSKINKAKRVIK